MIYPDAKPRHLELAESMGVPIDAVMFAEIKTGQITIESLKGNTEAAQDIFEKFLADLDHYWPLSPAALRSRDAGEERHPLFNEETNDGEEKEGSQ